jgi:tRNA-2-methylthio-N6-dimethylallyladenosine synthase
MPDDVSDDEKDRRWRMIDALCERILEEKNALLLGQRVEVLVEDKVRDRWKGRTPHNRLVFFPSEDALRGALVDVHVTKTGAFSLQAEDPRVLIPPPNLPASTPRLRDFLPA